MFLLVNFVAVCALFRGAVAQVQCSELDDTWFRPEGAFEGWPDPTCPGEPGLDLTYDMFTTGTTLGDPLDKYTVPAVYNNAWPTFFLIHGWGGDGDFEWMTPMKNAIVDNENANVIIVGWGGPEGAEDNNYFRSASDTRTVGAYTAEVMVNLITSGGGQASNFHIVGHSLGAQVTGHAGRWASGKALMPAMCTGLDPAGPFFINNTDRTVGIYNDCGSFVQIIHTDQSLGSTPSDGGSDVFLGDQDFFVNGGQEQPGCGGNSCDHSRAYLIFEESIKERHAITGDCHFATQICDNSGNIPGSCSTCGLDCPLMGMYATAGRQGRFNFATGQFAPYCSQ